MRFNDEPFLLNSNMETLLNRQGVNLVPLLILYKRACRFGRVGRWLLLSAFAGLLWSGVFTGLAVFLSADDRMAMASGSVIMGINGLIMTAIALKDAWCRFQNYKLAKDLFFENGFNTKIAQLFIKSRCQREAVWVAARDLGMAPALERYFQQMGYQWYHLVPDRLLEKPGILFSLRFWQKTMFVPHYDSKYFLW